MKLSKSVVASVVIAGALMAGSVSAMTVERLNTATSSVNVNVSVKDGVATLFGSVDNHFERVQAQNAAAKLEGVDSVRNLLTFSQ